MQLLNTNESNTKIRKSASGTEYRIASLSLYPDILTCPGSALANCMDACLNQLAGDVCKALLTLGNLKLIFIIVTRRGFSSCLMTSCLLSSALVLGKAKHR